MVSTSEKARGKGSVLNEPFLDILRNGKQSLRGCTTLSVINICDRRCRILFLAELVSPRSVCAKEQTMGLEINSLLPPFPSHLFSTLQAVAVLWTVDLSFSAVGLCLLMSPCPAFPFDTRCPSRLSPKLLSHPHLSHPYSLGCSLLISLGDRRLTPLLCFGSTGLLPRVGGAPPPSIQILLVLSGLLYRSTSWWPLLCL